MSNVKKPEPVAEVVCTHAQGWSMRWIGEESGKRNVPPLESKLITTDQAEAYANALAAERVREALELAAAAVERHDKKGREFVKGSLWDQLSKETSDRIRALIPKQ